MSILMGTQPKFMMCNFESIFCELCDIRAKDDSSHVLFECEGLKTIRETNWARVLLAMPNNMVNDVHNMTPGEKTVLLMSCYGGSFIPEWTNMYAQTAIFEHSV